MAGSWNMLRQVTGKLRDVWLYEVRMAGFITLLANALE